MFNLIAAIFSIALITLLGVASIYYGGTAFSNHSAKINATQIINQGQQIAGAVQFQRTLSQGISIASDQPSCDNSFSSDPVTAALGDRNSCAIFKLLNLGFLSAIPQPSQNILLTQFSFWALSDDASAAYIIFTENGEIVDAICSEISENQGGAERLAMMDNVTNLPFSAEAFGFENEGRLFRCANFENSSGATLTAFGFRT